MTDFNLLERFSAFLVAGHVLESPELGYVAHTPISTILQDPKAVLFYTHIFNFFLLPMSRWPEYFKQHGPSEPTSTSTPFGHASGQPDKSLYEILGARPDMAESFNRTMAIALGDMPVIGAYDFSWIEEYVTSCEQDSGECTRPLIVDVGGGKGQALNAILRRYPRISSRLCVLQDQAQAIQEATDENEEVLRPVQKTVSSFFDEQPVKGALVYHIRRVLNDWPDGDCVIILRHIREACEPDSRVLVSEQLLPPEPSLDISAGDLWMMNFGGKRRSGRMFSELALKAGLRVSSISKEDSSNSAVIEMVSIGDDV
ncbi:hypothetical protein CNMCM5623_007516 [Aspergillus felis]|uniref:O-methyltransferase C-terminal domain-containing protein n=1 Tax=Aspergillus felis TaxID=1287682 RepID=A0A8H6PIR4_9EURO|nr:hypothetical protein CNMCM5623_007516 [Aspergillus felis]KAF7181530.1 hypothetical protein CNMCM7691_000749 [Aspergillus felis]